MNRVPGNELSVLEESNRQKYAQDRANAGQSRKKRRALKNLVSNLV